MKNAFSLATAAGFLLALASCKKDEVQVSASVSPAPVLTASTAAAGVLTSENASNAALIYTWTPVTFTLSDGTKPVMPVTYTLEFAKPGTNFDKIGTVAAGTNVSRDTVKVSDLNTALVKAGLTPTLPGTVDVRLRASYAGNQSDLLSGVSQLSATPYSVDLFVFGSSFGPLSDKSPFIQEQFKNSQGQIVHEGYLYAPNATNTFRLSNTSSSSGTVFGAGTGSIGAVNSIASGSTAELTLAGPRMYRIQVTMATKKIEAVATDWGIIGAATTGDGSGWNQSIPMTYNVADKVWKISNILLPGAGSGNNEFKFRANDAWDINLGDSNSKPNTSKLEQGGANLKTPGAGRYDVTLDLNNPEKYTYTVVKK
jgi:hypothetical protein